jgi:hypothetical protein
MEEEGKSDDELAPAGEEGALKKEKKAAANEFKSVFKAEAKEISYLVTDADFLAHMKVNYSPIFLVR